MSERQTTLAGMRVLDLSQGPATGLSTMILADFGAEVLLIERPGVSVFHQLPAAPLWRRGKQQLSLDLDTTSDRDTLHELLAGADVLITNWRSATLARHGLSYAQLHEQYPHLVVGLLTGFGSRGPLAGLPAYEHLVAAVAGRMRLFAGTVDRSGPVFSALQVAVHASAQTLTSGVLAALLQRGTHGVGRLVTTSLLQGLLPYEQGPMLGRQFPERFPALHALQSASETPPLPSLYYHPAQTADGRWMQFGNLLPHLFDNFLIATGLTDLLADPDFDPKQLSLPDAKQEAFRERMLKRIQERPVAEWMTDLIADGGVVAGPYQTTQEALVDPDIVANGHAIPRASGGTQLGPLARLTETPATPGPDAAAIDRDSGYAQHWRAQPRPAPTRAVADSPPLAGIKVIELATIIAAPFAASMLADLGATVIKVEQIGGDPYRSMGAGIGSARVNAGKQSVAVDLKSAAGQAVVQRLLRDADVLIHNYRPGVPERLGIGYAALAAANPRLVYIQSNGYGPEGPSALRPSTHPIPGAAMGGVLFQMGERVPDERLDADALRLWTSRLMRANEVNPDPNTAVVVASSTLLALAARERTGRGQQVFVDMFGANAYANHDDFLSYPGKPSRALADTLGHGLSPTYRLYQCADDHWVFLAIPQRHEQARFIEALANAGFVPPDLESLGDASAQTTQALSALFRERPAATWEELLTRADVGCLQADANLPSDFWFEHPQAQANGGTQEVVHPHWGPYQRHGALLRFDDQDAQLAGPPLAGQHNATVLADHGYSTAEIAEMHASGVLWAEPQDVGG